MKFKELTNTADAALLAQLKELQAESHDLQMKARLGQLKTTHQLKAVRKDIARIKTMITQRSNAAK